MRTRKPCPGCGLPDPQREAEKVCSDCRRAIEAGKAARAKEEKGARFSIPRADWWPSFHYRGKTAEGLSDLFGEMIHALVAKPKFVRYAGERIPRSGQDGGHSWWEPIMVTKVAGDLVDRVDQAVRKALDEAFVQGFEEGNNLLAQLAAGAVTNDAFNDRVLAYTKPKDKRALY